MLVNFYLVMREGLIVRQHHDLCHAGYKKVQSALVKHWHWPDMKKDIRTTVDNCAPCQLLKAKRMRAHRHFRAKVFCTPRTSWGCDFYGVAKSLKGYALQHPGSHRPSYGRGQTVRVPAKNSTGRNTLPITWHNTERRMSPAYPH